jgi:hypothetical protein
MCYIDGQNNKYSGYMRAVTGSTEVYQPTVGNQRFHHEANDNGRRLVIIAPFRNVGFWN